MALRTYINVTLPPPCTPSGNDSNIKEGRKGQKKERGSMGRGRESLVKWNLVTDASWGARPCRRGWRLYIVCMYALVVRRRVHVYEFVCVISCRKRTGHERTSRERLFFTRRDHFTLPPEAFFPPKAFSCS